MNLAEEAHIQVLNALVADAVAKNPNRAKPKSQDIINPNFHDLFVANDDINGGNGNDIVIGDDLSILMPVINGDRDEHADHFSNVSWTTWYNTEVALSDQQDARDANWMPTSMPIIQALAVDCPVTRTWP